MSRAPFVFRMIPVATTIMEPLLWPSSKASLMKPIRIAALDKK